MAVTRPANCWATTKAVGDFWLAQVVFLCQSWLRCTSEHSMICVQEYYIHTLQSFLYMRHAQAYPHVCLSACLQCLWLPASARVHVSVGLLVLV